MRQETRSGRPATDNITYTQYHAGTGARTTRVPPSQSVFLPPRMGKLLDMVPSLPLVGPPLSELRRNEAVSS